MRDYNKKGQAVVEMAMFGSLVLLIFATLLSYLQRSNDQQYVQMEAFRRALQKGCTYQSTDGDGAGASVQLTLLENRRHAELSGGFRKGSAQSLSASSSVFWAIPKVEEDAEAQNLIVYRINEDEQTWNYRDFVPKEHDSTDDEGDERQRYWSFEVEDLGTSSNLTFNEQVGKQESAQAITNTKSSRLQDAITTTLPYTVKEKDKDDKDYESIIREGTLWAPQQGVYRDTDGQYKYSQAAVGTVVERSRTWRTEF